MSETIELFELFKILKKKWYLILLAVLIGIGTGYTITEYVIAPKYSASTNIIVSRPQGGDQILDLGQIQTNIHMINTYQDVIQDAVILEKVSLEMNQVLDQQQLADRIDVIIHENSQIFGLQVTDTDPQRAALIANLVANTFSNNIGEIINVENVAILSPAVADPEPISPNLLINLTIGTLAGIFIGVSVVLIWSMADTKVRDESVIKEELNWINLGTVSRMQNTSISHKSKEEPISNLDQVQRERLNEPVKTRQIY